MNLKGICVLVLIASVAPCDIYSQDADSLINKGRWLMEKGEYSAALPLLEHHLASFPNEPAVMELLGDCHVMTGNTAEAIDFYRKTLVYKPDLSRLYYKLGNAYYISDNTDSSVNYFRKYIRREPNSAEGHIRLALGFLNYPVPEKDSGLFYSKRALELEPHHSPAATVVAMSYFSKNDYNSARKTALEAFRSDTVDIQLLRTLGLSSFFLKDYENSHKYFTKAVRNLPDNKLLRNYQALSVILRNTDPRKVYYTEDGRIKFNRINSGSIRTIENEASEAKGAYSYDQLLKKFRKDPSSLGLDQYFMLYFGYSGQPGYSPYTSVDEELNRYINTDLNRAAEIAEKLLNTYPTNFPLYSTLAGIYYQLGRYDKYSASILPYLGFLESVKSSGDGKSPASAMIVTYISHEYEIAFNMGYKISGQKIVSDRKQVIDMLSGKDSEGNDVTLYFNIEKPYRDLSRILKKSESHQ